MKKSLAATTRCMFSLGVLGGAVAAVPPGALSSRTLGNPPAQPAPAQPSPATRATVLPGAQSPVQSAMPQAAQPPPPAAAVVQQPAVISGALQTNPGVAARTPANTGALTAVTGSKQSKYTPDRMQSLQSQVTLKSSEDATALSARKLATTGTTTTTGLSGNGSGLALARGAAAASASGLTSGPSLATRASNSGSAKLTEGIWAVNNKEHDFVMTPGGHVTIDGFGFGGTIGQVFLFPSGPAQRLAFQVIDWHDGEIYALLPAGLRGMPDQAAKLQVITRAGRTYLLDGKFYATREETFVSAHLDQVIELHPNSGWSASITSEGDVVRSDSNCPSPGTDQLYFKPLPGGFEVSGISAWFGRTDTGNSDLQGHSGSRRFSPGYALGEWTTGSLAQSRLRSITVDVMPVSWGVWHSHTDGSMGYFGRPDVCASSYRVNVNLVGPAGVAPF